MFIDVVNEYILITQLTSKNSLKLYNESNLTTLYCFLQNNMLNLPRFLICYTFNRLIRII